MSVPLLFAQGTYKEVDIPDSTSTICSGINDAGDIVGSYYIVPEGLWAGYILTPSGEVTRLLENGVETFATGINSKQQVVGILGGSPTTGWLWDPQTRAFTEIAEDGATYTDAVAINDAGTVAGWFEPCGTGGNGNEPCGFEWSGSTYTTIAYPGALTTFVLGIDHRGDLFGTAGTESQGANFRLSQGQYSVISGLPASTYEVYGVSPSGSILVGFTLSGGAITGSFVNQNGVITLLQYPGGTKTEATGVNDSGVVVGSFVAGNGNTHGFTWTPPAPK